MPTNTQPNVGLLLKFGSTSAECQVIDLSFTLPGIGASTITEVACPGGTVSEPGTVSSGSLTGTTFTDTADTGVTKILADAHAAQKTNPSTTIAYELTFFPELGPTKGMKYTGTLRVNSFKLDFSKPGINRHALDLEVLTATFARPTSVTREAEAA